MKLKSLRVAVVLFILTALTSNIVSSTLAKYVVSDSSTDSARVAKWGITVFAEGNLFGENYEKAPNNTIIASDDGRAITVTSSHTAAVDNVVAPGTKNETGISFGISGKAETAVRVDVTIRNKSIVLRGNVFYVMHKLVDVTEKSFAMLQERYGELYIADGESFRKVQTYDGVQNYYAVDNATDLTESNWPYCPVVFELRPTVAGNGLSCTRAGINATGRYSINAQDKNLDIISLLLKWFSLNAGEDWPRLGDDNVFERTISKVFPAGTDLKTIAYGGAGYGMTSECLTWAWDYQQSANADLYNNADNILGRLAAEKQYKAQHNGSLMDDNFVVICNRTYSWVGNHQLNIVSSKNDDVLIRPIENIDFCLDTMFELEMTVSQVD